MILKILVERSDNSQTQRRVYPRKDGTGYQVSRREADDLVEEYLVLNNGHSRRMEELSNTRVRHVNQSGKRLHL
jgi:hypothetical protein